MLRSKIYSNLSSDLKITTKVFMGIEHIYILLTNKQTIFAEPSVYSGFYFLPCNSHCRDLDFQAIHPYV